MTTNDPVIWFLFLNTLVLIPKRKRLPGVDRIRCGKSGTPSANTCIYARWSSWCCGLGSHAPMFETIYIYGGKAYLCACKYTSFLLLNDKYISRLVDNYDFNSYLCVSKYTQSSYRLLIITLKIRIDMISTYDYVFTATPNYHFHSQLCI